MIRMQLLSYNTALLDQSHCHGLLPSHPTEYYILPNLFVAVFVGILEWSQGNHDYI